MIQSLSVSEAEYIAHRLAKELMNYDEPLSDFSTRYPGKLENCLAVPFTYVGGRYVHWTLVERAAVLFYSVIKNHPFDNGNKRMAVTLTLVFLFKNKKFLNIHQSNMYEIAKEVAKSKPPERNIQIGALTLLFKKHLIETQP